MCPEGCHEIVGTTEVANRWTARGRARAHQPAFQATRQRAQPHEGVVPDCDCDVSDQADWSRNHDAALDKAHRAKPASWSAKAPSARDRRAGFRAAVPQLEAVVPKAGAVPASRQWDRRHDLQPLGARSPAPPP